LDEKSLSRQLVALNHIGIALSSERNLESLLWLIVREARRFTRAEGGSLYIRKGDYLVFEVAQNEPLGIGLNKEGEKGVFQKATIPLDTSSMAGFVALTGKVINVPDVYHIPPDRPYQFFKGFDEQNRYRTRSMLVVPMVDQEGHILGVLQLVNARDEQGAVVAFDPSVEELVRSLASQAAVSYKNARLTEELKAAYLDTLFRLSVAAEFRDDDTAVHIKRMSGYCAVLAQALGWDHDLVEEFRVASQMHDVGKLGIPDAILQKPGKLTEEEYEIMKQHTIIGGRILGGSQAPILKMSEEIALTHHEKIDGTGYPRRLQGDRIPMTGRITAIADVFDALTSKRCYKPAYSIEKAKAIMEEGKGKHFDEGLVELFLRSFDKILEVKDHFERHGASTMPSAPPWWVSEVNEVKK